VEHVICRFGTPLAIVTDRAKELDGELMRELCRLLDVDKLRTTAYKASTNAVAERFQRTINSMIGCMIDEFQRDWYSLLPYVMAAYHSSRHDASRLKKLSLDSADVKNYRPISNLKVTSMLLERLVASQLMKYLQENKLLPDHQSAHRAFCSTETVIARVLSDIYTALDSGDIAALALLDLSAAFDTNPLTDLFIPLKQPCFLSTTILFVP